MICPACNENALPQAKGRCRACDRTAGERRKYLAGEHDPSEVRRAKQRGWHSSKYATPERDDLGAHHFGRSSRADASWLFRRPE